MAENIEQIITKLLTEILIANGISVTPTRDMSLIDSGLVDSLNIVTFVGQLEKVFGITVSMPDMTMDNFDKIEFICEFVKSKQASR